MGLRGPKPNAKETLQLTGSHHTSDRKGEIAIVPGEPEPPDWLDERGLRQWDRMVTRLRNQNLLSESWRESLTCYCEAWSEYEALIEACDGQPLVVYGKSGAPYANPLFSAKAKAWERVIKIGTHFGFTPSSKTGIKSEPGQTKNRKGYIKTA